MPARRTSHASDHSHGRLHTHDEHSKAQREIKLIKLSLAVSAMFMLVEIVVGYQFQVLSLVADSYHMLSDLAAFIVQLYARELLQMPRHATKHTTGFTFGLARVQIVANLIQGALLMALCLTLALEGLQHMYNPEVVTMPPIVIAVGVAALIWNTLNFFWFSDGHSHSHSHSLDHVDDDGILHPIQYRQRAILSARAARYQLLRPFTLGHGGVGRSDSLKSNASTIRMRQEERDKPPEKEAKSALAIHALGDAMANIAVIFDGVMFLLLGPKQSWWSGRVGTWAGIVYVDPICTMAVLWIILKHSFPLVTSSAFALMQAVEPGQINAYRRILDEPSKEWLGRWQLRSHYTIEHEHLHVWILDANTKLASVKLLLYAKKMDHQSQWTTMQLNDLVDRCKRNVFQRLSKLKQRRWLIDPEFVTVEVEVMPTISPKDVRPLTADIGSESNSEQWSDEAQMGLRQVYNRTVRR
ncbi:hypothetical protein ACM66B_006853 [Microbotryomycetes sp. NB124-2]